MLGAEGLLGRGGQGVPRTPGALQAGSPGVAVGADELDQVRED